MARTHSDVAFSLHSSRLASVVLYVLSCFDYFDFLKGEMARVSRPAECKKWANPLAKQPIATKLAQNIGNLILYNRTSPKWF